MGFALSMLFTAGWIAIFIFRVEDRGDSLPHYDANERFWLYLTPFLLSPHTALSCITMSIKALDVPRAQIAVVMLVSALAFWFWGRVLIGLIRTTRTPDQLPLAFRRDGAFGIVRHPLYASLVVYMVALAVAAWTIWSAATCIAAIIGIAVRAVQEERRLRAQLGAEYEEYAREVPRLIPFVW